MCVCVCVLIYIDYFFVRFFRWLFSFFYLFIFFFIFDVLLFHMTHNNLSSKCNERNSHQRVAIICGSSRRTIWSNFFVTFTPAVDQSFMSIFLLYNPIDNKLTCVDATIVCRAISYYVHTYRIPYYCIIVILWIDR